MGNARDGIRGPAARLGRARLLYSAESGQCFHRPCLGTREFPANFRLLGEGEPDPVSTLDARDRDRDLGWMTYEPGYGPDAPARFFRARLEGGVLEVAKLAAQGLAA